MQKKKTSKTNFKIALSTMMCIFSLASLFTGTIAWFAMNTSASASGLSVSVDAGSRIQILSCYAVRYDGNYGAFAADVMNGNASIAMSEYDYIFTDRNVNTPVFLRMEITGAETDKDLIVTIPCSGTYKVNNKIEPYLSNVVSAKFMCGLKTGNTISADNYTWSGDGVTSSQVVNSYQGMLANAKDAVGTPYVTASSKQSSITLTLPAASFSDFITTRDGQDVVVIFVGFDYHVTGSINLVSDYLESHGMAEHSLTFASDIERVTLDSEDTDE